MKAAKVDGVMYKVGLPLVDEGNLRLFHFSATIPRKNLSTICV